MHSLIVFSLITISCHGLNVRIAGRSKDCFTKKVRCVCVSTLLKKKNVHIDVV